MCVGVGGGGGGGHWPICSSKGTKAISESKRMAILSKCMWRGPVARLCAPCALESVILSQLVPQRARKQTIELRSQSCTQLQLGLFVMFISSALACATYLPR